MTLSIVVTRPVISVTTSGGGIQPGLITGSGLTMGTDKLLGRDTAGTGAIEELAIGTGLALSGGTLSATGTGTVTSVALTAPTGFSVSGSPITTSGTLALSLDTQSAGEVLAGPTSGPDATPAFRALVATDIPTIAQYQVMNLTTDLAAKADDATTISAGTGLTGGGDLSANRTISASFGAVAGTICQGDDARLSDARTPTAHAASHASIGPDPVTLAQSQITNLTTDLGNKVDNGAITGGDLTMNTARLLGRDTVGVGAVEEITVGSGLSLSGGSLSATATGTVTSVGLALPADFTVSGSPVTTSGTLTGAWATQAANKVLAGPVSGGAATPAFRSLVVADTDFPHIKHGIARLTGNAMPATLSYVAGTRILTATPVSVSYDVWNQGSKTTETGAQAFPAHTNATGAYFVDYDATLTKEATTTPWDLLTKIPVALVYYNATLVDAIVYNELHNDRRNLNAHAELHEAVGTYKVSGCDVSGYTLNTDSDAANTYAIASGLVADEDIRWPTTALADAGPYFLVRKEGAGGTLTWLGTNVVPFFYTGGSFINYNQFTGGAWQLTALTNNQFVNYYIFGTTATDGAKSYHIMPGQAVHSTLSAAQAESWTSVGLGGLLQEYVPLYQITYQAKTANTSTGKVQTVAVTAINVSRASTTAAGAASLPGGADTEVQFNDAGAFGGDSTFTYNKTTKTLSVDGTKSAASGTESTLVVNPVINQSGTASYAALAISVTETATGSGAKNLLTGAVGGTVKFAVANNGGFLVSNGGTSFIYNTTDQTTNWEAIRAYFTSNIGTIETLKAGTGVARTLRLQSWTGSPARIDLNRGGVGGAGTSFIQFDCGSTANNKYVDFIGTLAASSGSQIAWSIDPTINQSGSAGYAILRVNPTHTAVGSGTKNLIEADVASTRYFAVDSAGRGIFGAGSQFTNQLQLNPSGIEGLLVYGSNFGGQPAIEMQFTGASGPTGGTYMVIGNDDGAAMASGDRLGLLIFQGAHDNANNRTNAVAIAGFASGAWAASDTPSDLAFYTCPDGSATRTEKLRITSEGALTANTSAAVIGNLLNLQVNSASKFAVNTAGGIISAATDNDPMGRLTLESGVPVSSTDQTAKTTVYYTPRNGNSIRLYNGANWTSYVFTELSLSLSGWTANKNNDIFIYDNAGTLTLERTEWTNDSTRATALVLQDGVWCKTGSLTRRYLGTIRTTGTTGQCEDSVNKRYVWNMYQRVARTIETSNSNSSWTYATATWRECNGGTGQTRGEFVVGVDDGEPVESRVFGYAYQTAGNNYVQVGLGVDSIVANPSSYISFLGDSPIMDRPAKPSATRLSAGYHYCTMMEYATAAATATISGGSTYNMFMLGRM